MPNQNISSKKVVMIIAFRDFKDEEYFVPKEILEKAGAEIKTASNSESASRRTKEEKRLFSSTKKGVAIGADGGEVKVDFLVSEINPAEFDVIVFIGGSGCLENLDNESSYRVAKATVLQGKVLASICISPVILAKAGVLKGKKATVWSSALDKSAIEILEENEAIYRAESVVQDGKIITASGPNAAKGFGEAIVEALTE
jgi:protease I